MQNESNARLVNRLTRTPPVVPEPPAWQKASAKAMHIALYALMIGLPVLGWLILSAKSEAIPFWGYTLPPLIGPNASSAKTNISVWSWESKERSCKKRAPGVRSAAVMFFFFIFRMTSRSFSIVDI